MVLTVSVHLQTHFNIHSDFFSSVTALLWTGIRMEIL